MGDSNWHVGIYPEVLKVITKILIDALSKGEIEPHSSTDKSVNKLLHSLSYWGLKRRKFWHVATILMSLIHYANWKK